MGKDPELEEFVWMYANCIAVDDFNTVLARELDWALPVDYVGDTDQWTNVDYVVNDYCEGRVFRTADKIKEVLQNLQHSEDAEDAASAKRYLAVIERTKRLYNKCRKGL